MPINDQDMYAMEMTFSRGLSTGWMHGVNHQELVGARYGKKRGPYVGARWCRILDRDTLELDALHIAMKPGDGVVFENLREHQSMSKAAACMKCSTTMCCPSATDLLRMERMPLGTHVYKTSDPALNRALRAVV